MPGKAEHAGQIRQIGIVSHENQNAIFGGTQRARHFIAAFSLLNRKENVLQKIRSPRASQVRSSASQVCVNCMEFKNDIQVLFGKPAPSEIFAAHAVRRLTIQRVLALRIKELLALLRDAASRAVLIGPPIIQLLVFAYAANLSPKQGA